MVSDGVLNPSGVRFGSTEIYAVTDTIQEIDDAICVGQQRSIDDNESVILFVKLKSRLKLSVSLVYTIKQAIRDRYTSRHVPRYVIEVDEIPYTVNGKICEVNVKQAVNGRQVVAGGTAANPGCIGLYEKFYHIEREMEILEPRLSKL